MKYASIFFMDATMKLFYHVAQYIFEVRMGLNSSQLKAFLSPFQFWFQG